jgi:CDP-diacylglycerol--glycerol-3-phosphate 3-phosphatidyltransferase
MATPPVERTPRGGSRDYQTEFRNRLIQSRLTPNAISLTGFALCVVAAVLILQGWWIAGGIAIIVGSVCDTLDGRYSRMSGKASPFGAFLDSTLDRVEEGVVLAAVAYRFSKEGDALTVIFSHEIAVCAVVIAVIASIMVSYTRARAEALGVECKVGIADRAVRVVILSAGLVFGDLKAIEPAVYVLAVMAVVTVLQRIFHVRSELNKPVTEAALPG